jgi:hypothetical protein
MKNLANSLHTKVHDWINAFGFRLNASQTNKSRSITVKHYFFKTFNFVERANNRHPERSSFICFDAYGEKIKVNTLLDLQTAFFENISQLK